MSAPVLTPDEAGRLAALQSYGVLDTPPEPEMDDLAALVAHLCGTPMALISFVDEHRQWFKARHGLTATETPRSVSFCGHAIQGPDLFIVSDAATDARFADNPLVTGEPHIRFYAGAPLITPDGHALGALCVLDRQPHSLTTGQQNALRVMARHVMAQLELQRQTREIARVNRALLGILEDQQLAEKELRRHAAFLEAQINSSPDAILVVDQQGTMIFHNQRFQDLWQFPAENASDPGEAKRLEFIAARTRDPEGFLAKVRHLYEHQDEVSQDVIELTDSTFLERYSSPVRGRDGHYYGRIWIFRDITEKRKLEAQFLRNQRMESIGTLAGGVAHDLNNVLTPIFMSLQILRERCTGRDNEELLELLVSSAQRGAAIVKQILSFARGVEGERAVVQLRHVIKEQEKICRDTFHKNIRIRTNVVADLWPVIGDVTQLHQVLMNLCVNARDAMPAGGGLTITAENTLLDEQYARMNPGAKAGPHVLLRVSDTGAGIPPDILDKIFDPFFTTKEVGKGTGLGLSTVLGIVRGHGGFVHVCSEPGKGTEFKVLLPAEPEAETHPPGAEPEQPPMGSGEMILVVDDEAVIRQVTGQTLEKHGYRVALAADGAEAVAAFVRHKDAIRAVITDMVMPTMDGPATIRALQHLQPDLKIIAVSGMMANASQAETGDQITFLHKPYTAEKLLQTIHQVLGGAAGR
jgi:two-component system cell cycle sensor histidine kinase/response regulator CckA